MAEASGVNRKRSQALQSKEHKTVSSAFLYTKTEHRMRWAASETAIAMGISNVPVLKIRKDAEEGPLVIPSTKKERKGVRIT
jgi:hypothetical protein